MSTSTSSIHKDSATWKILIHGKELSVNLKMFSRKRSTRFRSIKRKSRPESKNHWTKKMKKWMKKSTNSKKWMKK